MNAEGPQSVGVIAQPGVNHVAGQIHVAPVLHEAFLMNFQANVRQVFEARHAFHALQILGVAVSLPQRHGKSAHIANSSPQRIDEISPRGHRLGLDAVGSRREIHLGNVGKGFRHLARERDVHSRHALAAERPKPAAHAPHRQRIGLRQKAQHEPQKIGWKSLHDDGKKLFLNLKTES